jgi:hypothetical protein
MATITDAIFIIQLLIVLGITLAKVYNITLMAKFYSIQMSIILLVTFIIMWFLGNITAMFSLTSAYYYVIFRLESRLFILNFFLFIIEIILYLKLNVTDTQKAAHNSKENNT